MLSSTATANPVESPLLSPPEAYVEDRDDCLARMRHADRFADDPVHLSLMR
jgi:hypothetical protein